MVTPIGPIPAEQVVLHYQPVVSIDTRTIHGVEALARWLHPELGLLQPKRFIARVAASQAIVPLTRVVLEKAIEQQRDWRRDGVRLAMSVNVSALFLTGPDVAEEILKLLTCNDCDPRELTIEITETEVAHNPSIAREQLQRLRDAGVGVSMDDFGQGYSTPQRLVYFPFSNLKLDRSMVERAGRTSDGRSSLRRAVSLARNHRLSLTGEGVETEAQWAMLAGLRFDYAQGFLMAPALAEPDLLVWIEDATRSGRFAIRSISGAEGHHVDPY
jgi:EAL domain-containing protein (putative c-di-GMP-specific phosphodiesterase class I)